MAPAARITSASARAVCCLPAERKVTPAARPPSMTRPVTKAFVTTVRFSGRLAR